MTETLSKLGTERKLLNLIKDIYEKSIPNMILIGETLNSFPLRSGIKDRCMLSPLLYKISNIRPSQCHKKKKKSKVAGIKVHKQNKIIFLYASNTQLKFQCNKLIESEILKSNAIYNIIKIHQISKNKYTGKCVRSLH